MPRRPRPFWIKANYDTNVSGHSLAVEAPTHLKYGTIEDDLNYLLSDAAKQGMKAEELGIVQRLERWVSDFKQQHSGEGTPVLHLKHREGGEEWKDISSLTRKARPYVVPTDVYLGSGTAKIDVMEIIFGYMLHADGEPEGGK
jgi:hypothetical protein